MDGRKDPVLILNSLRSLYGRGVYPGRADNMGAPLWEDDPFHVLITTVLSQRTRDENTRVSAESLFGAYADPASIAAAPLGEIERLIRKAGFPHQKAMAIKEISRIIAEKGKVPADIGFLLSLPMVGRKTANCVLAYAFGLPAICVDTHVHRIANLLGLVDTSRPEDTEEALKKIVPPELWRDINSLFVRHGQVICLPRNPRCGQCPIREQCDYGQSR
ncbi:MAG TPA: endonuclease III [Candidatus Methanomethylophilaceae archaeon]|nr:endonuclease III [Candidatus Methanomethylophilaceae archaeon]